MTRPISFEVACSAYLHRFTMEHVPSWSQSPFTTGYDSYPAPQFRTDREWYEKTKFPKEEGHPGGRGTDCYTSGQTWPMGLKLSRPYKRQV